MSLAIISLLCSFNRPGVLSVPEFPDLSTRGFLDTKPYQGWVSSHRVVLIILKLLVDYSHNLCETHAPAWLAGKPSCRYKGCSWAGVYISSLVIVAYLPGP